jgi:hypothetical protein
MIKTAAIGFRAHSGWAVMVAVAGTLRSPSILDRRWIRLADPLVPGSRQPYHAAETLGFQQAEQLLNRCTDSSRLLARQGISAALTDLEKQDYEVRGCGILFASGRALPALPAILASHALIHTAEGELFRDVLLEAAEHYQLPVTRVKEREVLAQASAKFHLPTERLQQRLNEIKRSVGAPWRQDEKWAALVGWMALAAASHPAPAHERIQRGLQAFLA